ncbi:hypothetical protein D3C80_2200510 [compost metagenome]
MGFTSRAVAPVVAMVWTSLTICWGIDSAHYSTGIYPLPGPKGFISVNGYWRLES